MTGPKGIRPPPPPLPAARTQPAGHPAARQHGGAGFTSQGHQFAGAQFCVPSHTPARPGEPGPQHPPAAPPRALRGSPAQGLRGAHGRPGGASGKAIDGHANDQSTAVDAADDGGGGSGGGGGGEGGGMGHGGRRDGQGERGDRTSAGDRAPRKDGLPAAIFSRRQRAWREPGATPQRPLSPPLASRLDTWAVRAWQDGGGPALVAALAKRQRENEERERVRRFGAEGGQTNMPALRTLWLGDALAVRRVAGGGPLDVGGQSVAGLLRAHFPKPATPPDAVQRTLNLLRYPFWKLLVERRCTARQLGRVVSGMQMLCRGSDLLAPR